MWACVGPEVHTSNRLQRLKRTIPPLPTPPQPPDPPNHFPALSHSTGPSSLSAPWWPWTAAWCSSMAPGMPTTASTWRRRWVGASGRVGGHIRVGVSCLRQDLVRIPAEWQCQLHCMQQDVFSNLFSAAAFEPLSAAPYPYPYPYPALRYRPERRTCLQGRGTAAAHTCPPPPFTAAGGGAQGKRLAALIQYKPTADGSSFGGAVLAAAAAAAEDACAAAAPALVAAAAAPACAVSPAGKAGSPTRSKGRTPGGAGAIPSV